MSKLLENQEYSKFPDTRENEKRLGYLAEYCCVSKCKEVWSYDLDLSYVSMVN